jgi:hypothetical protein
VFADHFQYVGGQAAGYAHFFDFCGGFDGDGHMQLSGANGKGSILTASSRKP